MLSILHVSWRVVRSGAMRSGLWRARTLSRHVRVSRFRPSSLLDAVHPQHLLSFAQTVSSSTPLAFFSDRSRQASALSCWPGLQSARFLTWFCGIV